MMLLDPADTKPQPQASRTRCWQICCALCLVVLSIVGMKAWHFYNVYEEGMIYLHQMENDTMVAPAITLNGEQLEWYRVNDVVMGGHSTSELSATDEGYLRFEGVISTKDGGFASCSTAEKDLGLTSEVTGFRLTVVGDGQLYKFSIKTDHSVWTPVWGCDFPPQTLLPGGRSSFVLPLSHFHASRMGSHVDGISLSITEAISVGMSLALVDSEGNPNPRFGDGPFLLVLESLEVVRGPISSEETM